MTELETTQFIIERKQTLRTKMEAAKSALEQAKAALAVLDREYKALQVLERQLAPKGRASSRSERGAIRQKILQALAEKPDGLSATELIEALGTSGGEQGRISVKNALYAMTKAKAGSKPQLSQRNGVYVVEPASAAPGVT